MTSEKHPCPLALHWIWMLLSHWLPSSLASFLTYWLGLTLAVDLECFWCDEVTANAKEKKKAMLIFFLFLRFAVITVAVRGCGSTNERAIFPLKLGTIACLDLKYRQKKIYTDWNTCWCCYWKSKCSDFLKIWPMRTSSVKPEVMGLFLSVKTLTCFVSFFVFSFVFIFISNMCTFIIEDYNYY